MLTTDGAPEARTLVRRLRNEGFTLIELLVVITILGILAAITVFSVGGLTDKGEKSACKTDTATIRTAEEANYAVKTSYAPDIATLITNKFLASTSEYHTVTTAKPAGYAGADAPYYILTADRTGKDTGTNICGGALAGGVVVDGAVGAPN